VHSIGQQRRQFHAQPPSDDPTPSQADIQMTKAIIDIAAPLGISVHDQCARTGMRA
jgi:DNA repair protein RadC